MTTVHPQVSIRMNSAYRRSDGEFAPMKATLDGRTLELRVSLLCAMKVDVGELKAAIEILEDAQAATSGKALAAREDEREAERYPVEKLGEDAEDNGTMPENVAKLGEAVIGHRIVDAEKDGDEFTLTLDTGARVVLRNTSDCCAYTDLEGFLLNPVGVDHAITGGGTTEGYTKWHIYADFGDVVQMDVRWSCGNPFYYGYGFDIAVEPVTDEQEAV
jgi:hypothetical protein